MRKILLLIISALSALTFAPSAVAKVGVGVGLGKIQIDEELSPGGIYNLPSLPVLNTGDEDTEYEVEVTYLQDQPELIPPSEWFTFSPQRFPLGPGESRVVGVTLTLPLDARPGDYFAFLEAHPTAKGEGVTVGIAAATKLNFTIKPRGVFGAAVERIRSLFENNKPGSYIALGVLGGAILIYFGSQTLDIKVHLKRKKQRKEET